MLSSVCDDKHKKRRRLTCKLSSARTIEPLTKQPYRQLKAVVIFMKHQGKEIIQRLLALLVIVAMLAVMGIPPSVIFFFAIVAYFIWRAVRRSEQQEVVQIFNFYVNASEILRDEERRWFGFEIAEVIEQGENALRVMADPPPLIYFTLGALYHRIGDHDAATENLAYIVENEAGDECRRLKPSHELRRYVQTLRRLEREPSEGPQSVAALKYLSRARRNHAERLLAESREKQQQNAASKLMAAITPRLESVKDRETAAALAESIRHSTPPPPIAEVLRDLYEEGVVSSKQ